MAGYKLWAFKELLTSADLNGYLMTQAVPRFATAAERNAAIATPEPGMMAYTSDTKRTQVYQVFSGTGYWCPLPGTVVFQAADGAGTSLPASADTPLKWNTAILDYFGGFASGASDYVPKVPGQYMLNGAMAWVNNGTGDYRSGGWWVDGAALAGGTTALTHPAISRFVVIPARPVSVYCNGTTTSISLRMNHNASVALTAATGTSRPTITVTYAGPGT